MVGVGHRPSCACIIMDQKITLQGVPGDGVPFAELRGDCIAVPLDLDSDMLHANCAPDKAGNHVGSTTACKIRNFKKLAANPQRQAFAESGGGHTYEGHAAV